MDTAEYIQQAAYNRPLEKNNLDQALGRKIGERFIELMRKEVLTRSDVLELGALMSSEEVKLWNMSNPDRRVVGQLTAWINEAIEVLEVYHDYNPYIGESEEINLKHIIFSEGLYTPEEYAPIWETIKNKVILSMSHHVKFLLNIFFYAGRSSLSVNMEGFTAASSQKMIYDNRTTAPLDAGTVYKKE